MIEVSRTGDLRRQNRSTILRALFRDGETTRGVLGSALHLSQATVTKVVIGLIEEGLVYETGTLPSDGGRPTATIAIKPGGAYFVGANIGDQNVAAKVFDLAFASHSSVSKPMVSHDVTASEIATTLTAVIDEAIEAAGMPTVHAIGLGMPGIVEYSDDPGNGAAKGPITLYAQSLGWAPTPVQAFYGGSDIPVFADNASKRLAAVEMWFGAARGVSDGIVALFGRGVGVGIISGGEILQGAMSSAGEWGHTKISLGGPLCNCGALGCIEAYVGGIAVARQWASVGGDPSANEELAFDQLLEAVSDGDSVASEVMESVLRVMGLGLGNLVNIFNPERIVVGGWMGLRLSPEQLSRLTEYTRASSLDRPALQFDLVRATVNDDAFELGGALLAAESLIRGPGRS